MSKMGKMGEMGLVLELELVWKWLEVEKGWKLQASATGSIVNRSLSLVLVSGKGSLELEIGN